MPESISLWCTNPTKEGENVATEQMIRHYAIQSEAVHIRDFHPLHVFTVQIVSVFKIKKEFLLSVWKVILPYSSVYSNEHPHKQMMN